MGFDDEDYERDKERTHLRMKRIGRLFTMKGSKFDSADNPLRRQREEITAEIEQDILERCKRYADPIPESGLTTESFG